MKEFIRSLEVFSSFELPNVVLITVDYVDNNRFSSSTYHLINKISLINKGFNSLTLFVDLIIYI